MMGLPNALLYAGIWPLAIRGLGRYTNLGSALLVMALCGSAIMPIVYNAFVGEIVAFESMKLAYWILIPCFAYIVWYGAHGNSIDTWSIKKLKNS
jgi:fucose permease